MTFVEAAHRLGVPEHDVTAVTEHSGGHVVRLRSGQLMLVSSTVARVYVPEVDDVPAVVTEPASKVFIGDEDVTELVAGKLKPVKKAAPKGRAGGSGS